MCLRALFVCAREIVDWFYGCLIGKLCNLQCIRRVGKREAEEALEKQMNVKKQKREGIEDSIQKKKAEAKIVMKKKEDSGSSSDESDSEEEQKVCSYFLCHVTILMKI